MAAQHTVIKSVKLFAEEILHTGLKLRKVILFGSYSTYKHHKYSDIDVALVADEFTGVGFLDIPKFVKILRNYITIHPITFSTKYFKKGDPLVDEIKKTGIEITI